ncbi:hexosaminidase D-like [Rhopilema esculentum]|uniref:hexosaminidase D-like n=1 Tax=Rhopilema esculentum TaxID=499914 RepID=UPI0031D12C1F|eukprot:gene17548-9178_t
MAIRQDPRLIVVVVCAVALAYWLIVPRGDTRSAVKNKVGDKKESSVHKGKDEARPGGHHAHEGLGLGHIDHMRSATQIESKRMTDQEKIARLQKDFENAQKEIEKLKDELISKEGLLQQASEKQKEAESKQNVESKKSVSTQTDGSIKFKAFSGHRIFHLDLKGSAPKLSYLRKLIPFLKSYGVTGILMEYEDTFPFEGDLSILKSKDAYTKAEIQELLGIAKELELLVIPLMQTFGHLEFVLKHKKFAHLRETEKITNSICPLNNDSRVLIKKMIKQILSLHENADWIHLGGDEVWNLKSCDKCKESPMSKADLFLHHMIPLFEFVKENTHGKTLPIIWDDMMRNWKVDQLKYIAKHVQPMIWAYVPDLKSYYKFPVGMWDRYSQAFLKVWIASSFKGADKPISNYVPISNHVQNHLSWLKIISSFPKNIQVVGITLTGWSRFDHYASMCELLPAAIPSLAFCLSALQKGYFDEELQKTVSVRLGFKKTLPISVTNFKALEVESGNFPGSDVFELVSKFEKANGWFNSGKVRENGWLGPFNVEDNHLSAIKLKLLEGQLMLVLTY